MSGQSPLPGLPDDVVREGRRKVAEDLLETFQNDWGGSDDIEDLIDHRWAVVTERDEDAWVTGLDTIQEIADHELGCIIGPEYSIEWVEGVYDLETGDQIRYDRTVRVEVNLKGAPEGREFEAFSKYPATN